MGVRPKRIQKPPGQMRHVLAENVKGELARQFPESPNRPKAFQEARGVPMETTRRALVEANGLTLDRIEEIADGLGVPTFRLLIPPEQVRRKFEAFDETTIIQKAPVFPEEEKPPTYHSSKQVEDAANSLRKRRLSSTRHQRKRG